MTTVGLPLYLEDRTGLNNNTDYDEIYDRMFLRTSSTPPRPGGGMTTTIYELGRRSSRRSTAYGDPLVVLDFGPNGSLGTILFVQLSMSMPMGHWLRKTAMFSRSLSRKFRASDSQEYRWEFSASPDEEIPEWSCTNASGYRVAQYNLKPPGQPAYRTSGNTLTISEAFSDLAVELLASLTIMRHIHQHNL
ncbi:hypothetical protein BD410DRAFT_793312 [Rickenella mellea]|uniref:DUF6593 domain-containing protein n=1 Tax=Rickenella mellea TaxID=50990 RepID=A0A4Y7PTM6_9AGAM|nr:hypothetical protein BD410DRAFT_793312 [Rickenella mellea]